MRRFVLGPVRSLVDRPVNWRALARAAAARGKPADFRDTALSAVGGPLNPESRAVICDLLIDAGEVEAAVSVVERSMRAGRPLDPGLAAQVERLRALRPTRGR